MSVVHGTRPGRWRTTILRKSRILVWVVSFYSIECTVVKLNTRPNPLIISKFLQFRTFWSQTKALFIIRCTLSVESWFKTFRVQKWPCWVQNFYYIKSPIFGVFRDANGQCPVVYLLKKISQNSSVVVSKLENDPLTSLSGKKVLLK